MCQCKRYQANAISIDIATPLNAKFRGFYKRSFTYYTIKNRLPKLLADSIDALLNHKNEIGEEFGRDAKVELKSVIRKMWNLKRELQTNDVLQMIVSNATHIKYFNDYLSLHPGVTYFSAPWLYTESYMYMRINEIFESSIHLKCLDYFRMQKREAYTSSINAINQLGAYFVSALNSDDFDTKGVFIQLLKLNLWGNKADLSFGSGQIEETYDALDRLKLLEPCILCDDSEKIWEVASNLDLPSDIIDIVLDNAGYELFADLCVADFILTKNLAICVRMHVKVYPYYVSDVTTNDLYWMLQEMSNSTIDHIQKLGTHWIQFIKDKRIIILEDNFWVTALTFSSMLNMKPELYKELSKAKLVMLKGDLNYRKLIGEKNWNPTTPLEVAVEGFRPSELCTLRIIKCETISGMSAHVVDNIEKCDPNWLINGKYGTIQFSRSSICI